MDTFAYILFCVLFGLSTVNGEYIYSPTVQIRNGKIRGRDHGHYLSFESIPYAEPPLGANRFSAPKPYSDNWPGTRDATYPPVKCMQWDQFLFREDLLDGVEDCLSVNVYTPSISNNMTYPVLVVIHGGAFMFGTSTAHGHDYVMKSGRAVVVKINYRLGPLGFLSTEDEVIPGNFGLKDQLLALEWTKTNIASFNGNPSNITILGFSAGGASVHLQMLNKGLEMLATAAISFSGTSFCPWAITRNPLQRTNILAAHLNCPTENSTAIKSCLLNKNAADIVRSAKLFQTFGYNPFTVFGPVIESKYAENAFLTDNPENIIRSGMSAAIPWLTSYTKEDGAYNAAELLQKDAYGKELIEVLNTRWNELSRSNLFLNNSIAEKYHRPFSNFLRKLYIRDERISIKNYHSVQKMYSDVLFRSGVEKALEAHKLYDQSPVYAYLYENPSTFGIGQLLAHRNDIEFGTVHGDDFKLLFKSGVHGDLSESDVAMSKKFVKMVVDFALTGDLQFGTCKFQENNSSTTRFMVMHIKNDSCNAISMQTLYST